jgi:hypothetical protein
MDFGDDLSEWSLQKSPRPALSSRRLTTSRAACFPKGTAPLPCCHRIRDYVVIVCDFPVQVAPNKQVLVLHHVDQCAVL